VPKLVNLKYKLIRQPFREIDHWDSVVNVTHSDFYFYPSLQVQKKIASQSNSGYGLIMNHHLNSKFFSFFHTKIYQ